MRRTKSHVRMSTLSAEQKSINAPLGILLVREAEKSKAMRREVISAANDDGEISE